MDFFASSQNPSKETQLTSVTKVQKISPKNEPFSGSLLR